MTMASQVASGLRGRPQQPSKSAPTAPDTPDDGLGEFEADGQETDVPSIGKIGKAQRPNGQAYRPRLIGGHEDLSLVRTAGGNGEHILFYGPPGTGKTALAEASLFMDAVKDEEATAREGGDRFVHLGFESIVCGVDTTEGDFFGSYLENPDTGRFEWADGPLVRALRLGIPLYVDEIFLCDSRVLSSTLYPVMDGRTFLTVPMNPRLGRIPVPQGFFVIGAGNPDVPGADYSEALRSRFVHQIEVTSDWSLVKSLGVPSNIVTVAKSLDQRRRNGEISWSPQTRDLLLYKQARDRFGQAFALSGLLGKAPFEDRAVIQESMEAKFSSVQALALGERAR